MADGKLDERQRDNKARVKFHAIRRERISMERDGRNDISLIASLVRNPFTVNHHRDLFDEI